MKLSNASFAYFGLFLSREMQRLGHLGRLYTNLPWTRLGDLPSNKYRSQPALAAPMILRKLGFPGASVAVDSTTKFLFDSWVAAALEPCDVFHNFSGLGQKSFASARDRFDALTIVERGSSHIRYQSEIIADECARWNIAPPPWNEKGIASEEGEYAMCDRITVQSTFAERTFLQRGFSPDKLIKLPLGVDVRMFNPAPKHDDVFRVLYAGVCSIRKGIPYLLQAVEKLHGLPNFEFAVNGAVADEVRDIMGRYNQLYRWLGFQPLSKLREVYSSASVLVLPTIEDGFAKVVTEAMACGVPVVATGHCGALDVLTDGVEGFIVPIRDPDAIREKILFLYENPTIREEMGRAALVRARSLSNWQSYGERAAAAYQRALHQKRSAV